VIDLEDIANGGQVALWIAAGLGIVVPRIYEPDRRRRVIWKFDAGSKVLPGIIIEPVEGHTTGMYTRPSTGFGSVAAVAQLTNALNASRQGFFRRTTRSLQDPIEICFSSDQMAQEWCKTRDNVVVGGPKNNNLTCDLLVAYGCQGPAVVTPPTPEQDELMCDRTRPFRAPPDAEPDVALGLGVGTLMNTIYWFGEAYHGSVRDHDHEEPGAIGFTGTDYGVVLRLPSLMDSQHRTIVIFGAQTFGIQAAATWLVNAQSRSTPRKTRKTMAKHRNIAALVKARVNNGIVSRPELIEILALPDPLPTGPS
jgi:hypothetical protein